MKFKTFTLFSLLSCQSVLASTDLDWGYTDRQAPEHWTNINEKYHACSGVNQSPINIDQTINAQLTPLKFNYKSTAKDISNSHHTVLVNFNEGSSLTLDNKQFELKQFHLHTPSENTIQGKSYPVEMHLVHASADGELAVVAIMFEQGKENKNLARLWKELPKQENKPIALKQQYKANSFLPKNLNYYRYNGSLTTPPCSEGVRWIVLKEIQPISAQQLQQLSEYITHPNNRPVQAKNARLVME